MSSTMIEIHAGALSAKVSSYHEFLARYSRRSKTVYGFVEGKEDPSFYRGFIDLMLPDDWEVELWPAGNKDEVYRIHRDLDWRRFPKKRICFFVDRDLSDIIPERLRADMNIYVTKGYSIENDIVTKATCKRILTEVCGMSLLNHTELESVSQVFERELDSFSRQMLLAMAWIVAWRRGGKRPNLNDIQMRDLFTFRDGVLIGKPNPKGKASVAMYIHEQCNVVYEEHVDIGAVVAELTRVNTHKAVVRGKFVFWFLIEFCRAVNRDAAHLFPRLSKSPKMNLTLSCTNGIAIVGTRARLPRTLKIFLEATYCAYIARS